MSSSSDEFVVDAADVAVHARHLRVVRGKRVALHDFSVDIARGTVTGLLGPSGCGKTTLMRSIVGTQIVASGTVTVLGHPAGSPRCVAASATSRRNRPSTTTCASSTTCGISPTCTALRRRRRRRRRRRGGAVRPRPRLLRQPLRRAAHPGVAGVRIGIPARPAGARRTDRGTRPGAARRPVGAIPRTGAPRHHPAGVQPCHGRGRPLRRPVVDARRPAAGPHHPNQLREDTGCTSLEEAFLSVIRHTTAVPAG